MAVPPTTRLRDIDFGPFGLGDEAKGLMRGSMSPREYLAALAEKELYRDAIRFLAHWLRKREAIWWGTLCAWYAYRPAPPKKVSAALETVVHWVQQPDEANRRAAETAGEAVGNDTAAGMLALAVFCSGGSISLPNLPVVEAPPPATAQFVVNAIIMTIADIPAAELDSANHHFIQFGLDVRDGKNTWLAGRA